jgi:hypothetical protein
MKSKIFRVLMLLVITVSMAGCAGTCQRMKANGSVIGTTTGDWIVIKQSGGITTDVYLLNNIFVQSEQGSDGWLFIDGNQNPVHIGGDMKAIRVINNKEKIFNSYFEYHTEWDTCTYKERLKIRIKSGFAAPTIPANSAQTFILN